MNFLSIVIGGALGSVFRYLIIKSIPINFFPIATLVVNALGSLFVGVLFVIIVEKSIFPETIRLFLIVGFLGAFTTFSTFSLENLLLITQGFYLKAIVNIISNVLICLLLVFVGVIVTRYFLK